MNWFTTFHPVVFLSGLVAGSIGLTLLVIGWHGRRIDDHPICRKCRFDLHGLPDSTERCPECGIEITDPRNVLNGRRIKRRFAVAVSIFLLVLSSAFIISNLVAAFNAIQWIRLRPTPWLMNDTRSPNPARETAAARELARRISHDVLSIDDTTDLIARALSKQADPNTPWKISWGDILEQALLNGKLTTDQQAAMLRNAISPTLKLNLEPKREGDLHPRLKIGFVSGPLRIGSSGKFSLGGSITKVTIDDRPSSDIAADDPSHRFYHARGVISIFGGSGTQVLLEQKAIDLPPGKHTIKTWWIFDLVPTDRPGADPYASAESLLTGTFIVAAADDQKDVDNRDR